MYALRERRVHVTQEDFEMAVTKVSPHKSTYHCGYNGLSLVTGVRLQNNQNTLCHFFLFLSLFL